MKTTPPCVLTVVVLTLNETCHLPRLIRSFEKLPCRFIVVDSGSTDGTPELALSMGADVVSHPFENHAAQFNWALDHVTIDSTWTMRMDADEYLTPELATELAQILSSTPPNIGGFEIRRRIFFWGRWIRHGGYYPTWLLRIWRTGTGRLEDRFMDEHVVLTDGGICFLKNDFVDENLKGLGFWTVKHNGYADREVSDLLGSQTAVSGLSGQEAWRRRMKLLVYNQLPLFLRAFLFWLYRYWIRLGFLDGYPGLVFSFLQCFWYRFLIDAKLFEHRLLHPK